MLPETPVSQDHDLLIKLNENVLSLRDEMRQVTTAFNDKFADHEARLRVMEADADRNEGTLRAFRWLMAAITVTATVAEPLMLWLLNRHR